MKVVRIFLSFCFICVCVHCGFQGEQLTNADICNNAGVVQEFPNITERLITYLKPNGSDPVDDIELSYQFWYGNAGYDIYSGPPPQAFSCGTNIPLYTQGEIPQSTNISSVTICVDLREGQPCSYTLPIRVTFCDNLGHNVYNFYPEFQSGSAFCMSPSVAPELLYRTDVEVLIPPPIEVNEQMRYQFVCQFDQSTNLNYWYSVIWYINNQVVKEFPPLFHGPSLQQQTTLTEDMLGTSTLGFQIRCSYAVSINQNSEKGPKRSSPQRFIGIELLTPSVNLNDGQRSEIRIRSTVPVGCPSTAPDCALVVNINSPAVSVDNQCDPSSSFSSCGITVLPSPASQNYTVTLSADAALQYGSKTSMNVVTLQTSAVPFHPIWENYNIGDVTIRTSQDTTTIKGKRCSAVCDPHMLAFSGRRFEQHIGGQFILYKNTEWKQEIQIITAPCISSRDGRPYCVCGVAISVGKEVYILNHCPPLMSWDIRYLQCSTLGARLIEITRTGGNYKFKLPSGLTVQTNVYGSRGFLNLYIYPSDADQSSSGLCGRLGDNQFYLRDGTTTTYSSSREGMPVFSESWRVNGGDIDLFNDTDVQRLQDIQTGGFFCKCSTPPGSNVPVFTCEASDACSPSFVPSQSVTQCTPGPVDVKRAVHDHLTRRTQHGHRQKRGAVVPEPTWRNGWSETKARDYCNELFSNSSIVELCKTLPNVDLTVPRDNCILDIEMMANTEYALVALETIISQCEREVIYDTSLHTSASPGQPSVLENFRGTVCPRECSLRGSCSNGVCTCSGRYGGVDCSYDRDLEPVIYRVANGGYCDLQTGLCSHISIYGGDFLTNEETLCKIEIKKLSDVGDTDKSEVNTVPSVVESIGEVRCPLRTNSRRRSSDDVPTADFVTVYQISVTNNGASFSNGTTVVVFNSRCQICTISGTEVQCQYTGDYCMSNGECYGNGEPHLVHKCYKCSVSDGVRKWIKSSGDGCGDDNMLWIIGAVMGGVIAIVIAVGIVMYVVKKKKMRVSEGLNGSAPPEYSEKQKP